MLLLLVLNLAIEPCAVASEADHDCPQCPPAEHHEMAAHNGHHGEADAANPCASIQSDCCELDEVNVNTRTGQLKANDVSDQPAAVSVGAPWLDTIRFELPILTTGPPVPVAASPPIHLLNCVFLD